MKKWSKAHAPPGTMAEERIFQECTIMYAMLTEDAKSPPRRNEKAERPWQKPFGSVDDPH